MRYGPGLVRRAGAVACCRNLIAMTPPAVLDATEGHGLTVEQRRRRTTQPGVRTGPTLRQLAGQSGADDSLRRVLPDADGARLVKSAFTSAI